MAGGKLPIGSQRFAVPTVGENPEVSSLETIRADEAVAVFDGTAVFVDVGTEVQLGVGRTRFAGANSRTGTQPAMTVPSTLMVYQSMSSSSTGPA